jgi:hypothetical protein
VKKEKKPKKAKAIKTRNAGTWSESEYFSRIRSSLRRVFRYFLPMQLALKKASRPSQSSNKKLKTEYQCAHCLHWFPRKFVEIDHKQEAGSLKCYDDIVPFIIRLTSENIDDYQILCKPDHLAKTKEYKLLKKK